MQHKHTRTHTHAQKHTYTHARTHDCVHMCNSYPFSQFVLDIVAIISFTAPTGWLKLFHSFTLVNVRLTCRNIYARFVRFVATSGHCVVVAASVLEHCSIRRAQDGVRSIGMTSLEVSNCVIEDTSRYGIYASLADRATTTVQHCVIQPGTKEGIYVETAYNTQHMTTLYVFESNVNSINVNSHSADVFVEGSTITKTTYYPIAVRSNYGMIRIDNCRFENTGRARAISFEERSYQPPFNKVR